MNTIDKYLDLTDSQQDNLSALTLNAKTANYDDLECAFKLKIEGKNLTIKAQHVLHQLMNGTINLNYYYEWCSHHFLNRDNHIFIFELSESKATQTQVKKFFTEKI